MPTPPSWLATEGDFRTSARNLTLSITVPYGKGAMKNNLTFEAITLDMQGAVALDNGFLRVPATLTRTGVFPYLLVNGQRRLELRTPEDVFAPDSIQSFEGTTLVNNHPYEEGGVVNSKNFKKLTIGNVSNVHRNGNWLDGLITISDADAIADVLAGKTQLSCGYFKALEEKQGIFTDDSGNQHPYTHVQHGIRGNHVALVDVARAGPEARLRLDADQDTSILVTDEMANLETVKEVTPMKTLTLDSLPAEMPEASAAIVTKVLGDRDAKITAQAATIMELETIAKTSKTSLDKLQASFDSAESKLKEATDPAKFNAAVTARVSLESGARKILGEATDLSKLDARQIKVAVVGKLAPALTCDGKSDDYVDAAYEIHTTSAKAGNAASAVVTAQLKNGDTKVVATVATDAVEETPFEKMQREATTSKPWEFANKLGK